MTDTVVVWITEGTWRAAVDAALRFVPPDTLAGASAGELLAAAAARLGRPCERISRRGAPEREVVTAAADAALLIVARDGDRSRLGPKSLGKPARFVVDHAPCPVLLVWPGPAPGVATIPPPPPHGYHPPRDPRPPHPPGADPHRR